MLSSGDSRGEKKPTNGRFVRMSGAFYGNVHKLNSDFIVIGAGIIGLTTAHEVASRGASVTLLERGEVGREASWAGGGILATLPPWEPSPPLSNFADASARMYPALVEELISETGIDPEHEQSGALALPPYDEQKALDWCRDNRVLIKRVSARDHAPALNTQADALFLPAVAQIRTPRLLKALQRRLRDQGVRILEHSEVRELNVRGKRVVSVSTGVGEFAAGNAIVCAGAWSQKLLGAFASNFATAPVKGQMLLFKSEIGLLKPIVLQDEFYLIPRRDGHILAGSTLEDAGFDKSVSGEVKHTLLEWAHALLPELYERNLAGQWAGLRPASKNPTIDRHPDFENLYLNSGHFRYGVTLAPGSARMLASLIFDEPQPFARESFRWPALN
jgi:glycine oxidase